MRGERPHAACQRALLLCGIAALALHTSANGDVVEAAAPSSVGAGFVPATLNEEDAVLLELAACGASEPGAPSEDAWSLSSEPELDLAVLLELHSVAESHVRTLARRLHASRRGDLARRSAATGAGHAGLWAAENDAAAGAGEQAAESGEDAEGGLEEDAGDSAVGEEQAADDALPQREALQHQRFRRSGRAAAAAAERGQGGAEVQVEGHAEGQLQVEGQAAAAAHARFVSGLFSRIKARLTSLVGKGQAAGAGASAMAAGGASKLSGLAGSAKGLASSAQGMVGGSAGSLIDGLMKKATAALGTEGSLFPRTCPGSPVPCSGHGSCDPTAGMCTCTKPFRGADCGFDAGVFRQVWLGCHVQPLPSHVVDVCKSALQGQNRCPGYRLLSYQLCNYTCPLVEGGNCGMESIKEACTDPLIKCPQLCTAMLTWYCQLDDFDAGLVRIGKAPGSVKLPASQALIDKFSGMAEALATGLNASALQLPSPAPATPAPKPGASPAAKSGGFVSKLKGLFGRG